MSRKQFQDKGRLIVKYLCKALNLLSEQKKQGKGKLIEHEKCHEMLFSATIDIMSFCLECESWIQIRKILIENKVFIDPVFDNDMMMIDALADKKPSEGNLN